MNPEDALRLKVGKNTPSYYNLVPQQCAGIKSPFDLVRASNGLAPEIISNTRFINWEGNNVAGIKLAGDLVVFSETNGETLMRNYDSLISSIGTSCEVIRITYETENERTAECFTYVPELNWDYECTKKKTNEFYSDDGIRYVTSIDFEQPSDNSGLPYPVVGILSIQKGGRGFLIKSSIYFYSNNLGAALNLNYAVFSDNAEESGNIIENYPEINKEMFRLVTSALDDL